MAHDVGAMQKRPKSTQERPVPKIEAKEPFIATTATIAISAHHSIGFPLPKLVFLIRQFLLYLTMCFAVEEVVFRGALDSHVY
jgi:hypothetical protein